MEVAEDVDDDDDDDGIDMDEEETTRRSPDGRTLLLLGVTIVLNIGLIIVMRM